MNPDPAQSSVAPRRRFTGDVWGGLAAMLVALPAALAYGVAAYGILGPNYVAFGVRAGLIGAVVIGVVTGAIGGASQLIAAPSAPAAAVLASLATGFVGSGLPPERSLSLLAMIGFLAGILQASYGASGGGRLIKFIPYPVVAGYLSAVGMMIFLSQLPKFLGVPVSSSLAHLITSPRLWSWPAIAVGAVTIVVMLGARRTTKLVPAAILALVAGVAAYLLLGLLRPDLLTLDGNPLVLGNLTQAPLGLSGVGSTIGAVGRIRPADLHLILMPAVTLSVLLSVDTLKTCVVVDTLTLRRHDSNRTLLGQGLANLLAAGVGGMPGSGMMGATLVNVESGGQTRIAGVLEGLFVLAAVLIFGRWIAWIPIAALAGILMVVGGRMFDWSSFHLLRQRSTVLDFLVIATVVVVAVATDLIAAAGAGVALAMVLFIRDQVHGTVIRRKIKGAQISSKQHRLPQEQAVLERYGGEITVCELQGSLFFGTTDQLFRDLEPDLKVTRFLVLDLRRLQSLDFTAVHLFEQFETILGEHGGWLLFSRVPPRRELRNYFIAHSAGDRHRNNRTFETLDDALQWAEDQVLETHAPTRTDAATPLALQDFDLLREFAEDHLLAAIEEATELRTVRAGAAVFSAGDESDELFLVRRGIVRITIPLNGSGYHTLAAFGQGNFFGEMAFLVRGTRSANATATTDVDLFVVSRARFDELSRAHPIVGVKMFARLARMLAVRLRRTDAELRAFYDA